MFSPWVGWNLVTIFLDFSAMGLVEEELVCPHVPVLRVLTRDRGELHREELHEGASGTAVHLEDVIVSPPQIGQCSRHIGTRPRIITRRDGSFRLNRYSIGQRVTKIVEPAVKCSYTLCLLFDINNVKVPGVYQ
ncbi:hypothetical protein KM043_017764 [Ampulex compressa]|nr:hypothetical protein KM043_017764 [Ampulex compressa]